MQLSVKSVGKCANNLVNHAFDKMNKSKNVQEAQGAKKYVDYMNNSY